MLQLVLGGARSGKSAVAERLAPAAGSRVIYLAPGQAWDVEMTERISRHRERRDPAWLTIEEPVHLAAAVRRHGAPGVCLLVDGLGTWVSNLLLADAAEEQVLQQVQDLLAALRETGTAAVVVSDEVGLGVVPPSLLGRQFRDVLGQANQLVAAAARRTLLVVAGIPVDLRALAVTL